MIDKIFKAYDVRATYPSPLNEEAAWKVGHATAQFLMRSRQQGGATRVKDENTIVVGESLRPAVVNLGRRPTFGGGEPTVEAHILDFAADLYNQRLRIAFEARLRDERAFSGKDALVAQIREDVAAARAILHSPGV